MTDLVNKTASDKELLAAYLVRASVIKDLANVPPEKLRDQVPQLVDVSHPTEDGLYKEAPRPSPNPDFSNHKICIVGAGIAGLYTAYMLKHLGIEYEILEASNRIGGRLYTHYFSKPEDPDTINHDYYDIGAMRFPKSPVMERTFKLFEQVGINQKLIDYDMSAPTQPTRFNDHTVFGYDPNDPDSTKFSEDPFFVGVKSGGTVPTETLKKPKVILDDAYDYYREKIKRDPATGFKYLIKHDKFSLRDYLSFVEDQDDETIHWLETLNSATGWFNQAFTENVLESLAFDYGPDIAWKCINGGTSELTKAILEKGNIVPKLETQVVSIRRDEKASDSKQMLVGVQRGETVVESSYAAVINTTTFGALQKMDLTGIHLPYSSKTAIRSLHYDSSTKVGIKFTHPWWRKLKGGRELTQGGLGKTDMPLRVCVYPSYNKNDPIDQPAVLLASYTWSQDSERIASFVTGGPSENEKALKELMIYNLARLHTDNEADFEELAGTIRVAWIKHHAYDWTKDKWAAGAFALFSPGQFATLYSTLVRPACDSRFVMVGEAASAHHAWIVGALDSAVRGLHLILTRFQQFNKRDELVRLFGLTGEVDYKTDFLQVALGMLKQKDQPNTISGPGNIVPVLDSAGGT